MKPKNHHQKGFTIVELLIAMGIFAMLAGISYTAINASINAQKIEATHSKELAKLQKTLHYINRDFGQIFRQEIDLRSNLLKIQTLQNNKLHYLEYEFKNDNLIRKDVTAEEVKISKKERKRIRKEEREQGQSNTREQESPELILMHDIRKPKIKLLTTKKADKWYDRWDREYETKHIVRIIEIQFEHKKFGLIKKLVLINE